MPLPRTPGRDTRGTHRNDDDPIPAIAHEIPDDDITWAVSATARGSLWKAQARARRHVDDPGTVSEG